MSIRYSFLSSLGWLPLLTLGAGMLVAPKVCAEAANSGYNAGVELAKEGKLDQALVTFEKALETDGRNSALLDATGAVYSLRGDLEKAEGYFLKCLAIDPQFAPARKNLAITYFNHGQYDLAAPQFQKLSELSPASTPIANLFLGMIAGKKGNNEQATKLLEGEGELLVRYPEAMLYLAQADIQLGKSQKAQPLLMEVARKTLDSSELNLLAHVAEKAGNLALAMDSLRKAAKLEPKREDNYLDFSTLCSDYGNYPLALEAAEIGLEHIPNSYRLFVQKGVVLENLGRFEEAETTLRGAAALEKDNSVALLSLAIVQTHAGQILDAEETLVSALKSFPDNYYMHYHLGKLLLEGEGGNATRAKEAFEQAIRSNPSFADSYFQLSKLYMRESPRQAEQNLVKCLRLDPNHAPAEYALARLYLSTGRRAEGQALIDRFERQRKAEKVKETEKPRIELARN